MVLVANSFLPRSVDGSVAGGGAEVTFSRVWVTAGVAGARGQVTGVTGWKPGGVLSYGVGG